MRYLKGCLALLLLGHPGLAHARHDPASLQAILGPDYRSIHLLRGSQNHLLVLSHLNGVFALLGVDTGAPVTAINAGSQKLFKVESVPANRLGLPSSIRMGGEPIGIGIINDFEAGGMKLGLRPVALVNLSRINEAKLYLNGRRKPMDGLIGADLLLDRGGVLDYRTQELFIRTGKDALNYLADKLPDAGFSRIPMEFDQGHFTVPCTIEGRPYRLVVDTGAFITLIDRGIMFRQGITGVRTRLTGQTINGRSSPVFDARLKEFIIGNIRLPPLDVGVTDLSEAWTRRGGDERAPVAGLLGGEILAESSAIIDLENLSLYLFHGETKRR